MLMYIEAKLPIFKFDNFKVQEMYIFGTQENFSLQVNSVSCSAHPLV